MKSVRLVLVVVLSAVSLQAWSGRNAMEVERDLFQAGRKAVVAEALMLQPEQAELFWPLYNKYRDDMRGVGDRTYKLLKTYADGYINGTLTDQVASKLIDESIKIDRDKLKLTRKHLKIFRRQFPDLLVARFFQLESKLDALVAAELARDVPLVPKQNPPEAPAGLQIQ